MEFLWNGKEMTSRWLAFEVDAYKVLSHVIFYWFSTGGGMEVKISERSMKINNFEHVL